MRLPLAISFLVIALASCRTSEESASQASSDTKTQPATSIATPAPSAPSTSSTSSAAKFGDAITIANDTPIAAITQTPSAYQGKAIATEGVVKAVCQERGCWMTLTDDANKTAMVRMHGHSFFIPKNASGKNARVQGTIVLVRDEKECDESKGQKAEIELDATGVELL